MNPGPVCFAHLPSVFCIAKLRHNYLPVVADGYLEYVRTALYARTSHTDRNSDRSAFSILIPTPPPYFPLTFFFSPKVFRFPVSVRPTSSLSSLSQNWKPISSSLLHTDLSFSFFHSTVPSTIMHEFVVCVCVCVCVRACVRACALARVWWGEGEGVSVIKWACPYVFVSASGSYDTGRHKWPNHYYTILLHRTLGSYTVKSVPLPC